jgi:hypothetical protein
VHSKSRVVLQALVGAQEKGKRFHVFVTEAGPDKSGVEMHKALIEAGIPATVILDAAVGYIMEKIQLVVMGAEGVVESGGIINKVRHATGNLDFRLYRKIASCTTFRPTFFNFSLFFCLLKRKLLPKLYFLRFDFQRWEGRGRGRGVLV